MITGMDRFVAAINGETSDRIPVFCILWDQGAKELGLPLQEFYSKGEYVAEAQLKMREKYGYDNVWGTIYVGKEAELLGCEKIRFVESGPPNVEDFVIKSYDDIERLQVPEVLEDHPAFAETLKCLEILNREVGGKYPICVYSSAAMTLPVLLMGMEKWLELLFMGPTDVRDELLRKCHDFFVNEITAFRRLGANLLLYANPFGSTDTIPMKFFMEHSLPWMEKDIQAVGPDGMIYYCGMSYFNNVIDTVLTRTGIRAFDISPFDDLAESKKIINGRGLTIGVINDVKLIDWTPGQVRAEVKRILNAGMPGGRFLFNTGVMPYNIPEENIKAMFAAAYEYGVQQGDG